MSFDYIPFRQAAALLYEGAWVAERTVAIADFLAGHAADMDSSVREIIAKGASLTAADAFKGQYRLADCRRRADAEWEKMDVMLLPTAAVHYTVDEIASDPIRRNNDLGRFTNWVNLLDACGIAVPAGFRKNGLPFGVTLLAPAFAEPQLSLLAQRFHRASDSGMGRSRAPVPETNIAAPAGAEVDLFVVGAHMTGMPLNRELTDLRARFVAAVRTAPDYKLYVLKNTTPAKPGLVRMSADDAGAIAGEIWRLTPEAFGTFVAKIPAPLGIGKIRVEDGRQVCGFLCESFALEGARDITSFGGWRAFLTKKNA